MDYDLSVKNKVVGIKQSQKAVVSAMADTASTIWLSGMYNSKVLSFSVIHLFIVFSPIFIKP